MRIGFYLACGRPIRPPHHLDTQMNNNISLTAAMSL